MTNREYAKTLSPQELVDRLEREVREGARQSGVNSERGWMISAIKEEIISRIPN